MNLRHTKTCKNKLTLSSGTLMFILKEKFSVFRNFFDQWIFSIEDCTFLHCSALDIFVQLSLDITLRVIEYGVTTCPGYGERCHRWISLIKWSLTTIVWRLKEIRYCSTVAKGSLETLAFINIECKKYKNLETKCVTTSPGLPYTSRIFNPFHITLNIQTWKYI